MSRKPRRRDPVPAAPAKVQAALDSIDANEFARRFAHEVNSNAKFAWFLGAGSSASSGIPTAGLLVRERWLPLLHSIKAPTEQDITKWAKSILPGYDPSLAASFYGDLIRLLFRTPQMRQEEIEILCAGKDPGFGYATLAQLVTRHGIALNVVLTTNFDDLVADALYLYTKQRPLVVHHEALAGYVRPARPRPIVLKLHGDQRLSPLNTAIETKSLNPDTEAAAQSLLNDRGVVFIGYAGGDKGILKMLNALPVNALSYTVYWVNPVEPTGKIREWLVKQNAVWVKNGSFDEVMLLLWLAFSLGHPASDRFDSIFASYHAAFTKLSVNIDTAYAPTPNTEALLAAKSEALTQLPSFWNVMARATSLEGSDPDAADTMYRAGVAKYPTAAPLLNQFARFLWEIQKDNDGAEAAYRRAVDTNPSDANSVGNLALFLYQVRRDHEGAESYFVRALTLEPTHANNNSNYATFLWRNHREPEKVEEHLRRAVASDPEHKGALTSLGVFLAEVRNRPEEGEPYLLRAVAGPPFRASSQAQYAIFLAKHRGAIKEAEQYFDVAFASSKDDPEIARLYGVFLEQYLKKPKEAAEWVGRAAALAPKDQVLRTRHAHFLWKVQGDKARAQTEYQAALSLDPADPSTLGDYANFLFESQLDDDEAERMALAAVAGNPREANHHANAARILLARGKSSGIGYVLNAMDLLVGAPWPQLELECHFYLFAHGTPQQADASLTAMRRMIGEGVRSPGWNLSRNVVRAQESNHPEGKWLPQLAEVIADRTPSTTLKSWARWILPTKK